MQYDQTDLRRVDVVELLNRWAQNEKRLGDRHAHAILYEMLRRDLFASVCRPQPILHGFEELGKEDESPAAPACDC